MGFAEEYGRIYEVLDFDELRKSPDVKSLYGKYSSKDMAIGKSPEFNFKIGNRFSWGGIELLLHRRRELYPT